MPLRLLAATLLALALAACGSETDGETSNDEPLTIEGQAPAADTSDIRNEPLKPSTLRDPRVETLTDAERRILQDYVNRGVRRDSLEDPASRRSLGGWLDSNLTVGQVIALYARVDEIEPVSPGQPATPGGLEQQSPARLPEGQQR